MMDFQKIELARVANGLTRKAVYQRAGVNSETWRRLALRKNEPNISTLRKLTSALEELVKERQARG